ncbi:alpha/beta hydrolase-fold protein [Saccharomonospora sp. NPDC046836]|uniref:alpha/beta hydrolase n=1 Tax=Saccharomonospora sp. NPDC046836 TaxID=3156921 RepID=UPI0033D0AB81
MPVAHDGATTRQRRGPSRRTILLAGAAGGVGAAAAATVAALSDSPSTPGYALRRSASSPVPAVLAGPGVTRVERVYSHARGRHVNLVLVLPVHAPPQGMPMSLLLHGLGGSARSAPADGLESRLSAQVTSLEVPPFGFIAVDGGDNYWHEHQRGDDPMAMLLDEVPAWLLERGLGGQDGTPFAATGTSMGGFGAFVYARRQRERGIELNAIAAISPAFMTSWTEAHRRKAFRNETDWTSLDPLRHLQATRGIPTAVWCGDQDRFITGVREFIQLTRPEVGYTGPGRHNGAFFRSTVPGLVAFLGKHAPGATSS